MKIVGGSDSGSNAELNRFARTFSTTEADASLLQLSHLEFAACEEPRTVGTVARIEQDLLEASGLLRRYRAEAGFDGVPGAECPFLSRFFRFVEQ
jgi:GH15 family glucan-1,4-alpha-glucosidase